MKTKLKEKIKTRIKKLIIHNTTKVTTTFDCKHTEEHTSTSASILKLQNYTLNQGTQWTFCTVNNRLSSNNYPVLILSNKITAYEKQIYMLQIHLLAK